MYILSNNEIKTYSILGHNLNSFINYFISIFRPFKNCFCFQFSTFVQNRLTTAILVGSTFGVMSNFLHLEILTILALAVFI